MKGNLGFILATNCSLEMFERCWQTTVIGKEQEPDKSPSVDLVLPSGPTGVDPSQTSFFQLP